MFSTVRRAAAILLVTLMIPAAAAAKHRPAQKHVQLALWTTQKVGAYGQHFVLHGLMTPVKPNARVRISLGGTIFAHVRVGKRGGFKLALRLHSGGPYRAGWYSSVSKPVSLTVRPQLEASIVGSKIVGQPLTLYAQLQPGRGGSIRVDVYRNSKRTFTASYRGHAVIKLGTSAFGEV